MTDFLNALKKEIEHLVTSYQGIKGVQLAVHLATRFHQEPEFNDEVVVKTLEEMVEEGSILEIEYVLPNMEYRAKSFFLPKDTTVSVNF